MFGSRASPSRVDADSIGGAHIDRLCVPSDGVWHPDSLAPMLMFWFGQSELDRQSFPFNPFALSQLSLHTCYAILLDDAAGES